MPHQDPFEDLSPGELAEFLRHRVYKKFAEICKMRMAAIKEDLCQAATMDAVARLQGELRGVEFWELFPSAMVQAIEEDKTDVASTDD